MKNVYIPEDFPSALRYVVSERGKEVLGQPVLVNILSDYGMYNDRRYLKYVLSHAQGHRYINEILNSTNWEVDSKSLASRLTNELGLQEHIAEYVVLSIGYGASVTDVKPELGVQKSAQPTITEYKDIQKSDATPIVVQPQINISQSGATFSFLNDSNLIHVSDKFYIRKDWYERSGIVFQDLTVEKFLSKYIHQNLYHVKGEILSNAQITAMRRLSILGLDKDGRIVYLDDIRNLELKGSGFGTNFNISADMFLPLDTFVRNLDNVERYIICVETSLGLYDTKMLQNEYSSPTLMPCLIGDTTAFSCFFLYKTNEKNIFYYYEIDTEKGVPTHNSRLCIYNKEGKLKQRIELNTNYSAINRHKEPAVYIMSESFETNIPVSEIGKIVYEP